MGLQLLDVAQFRALIASLPTSKTSSPLPCIPALPAPPEPTPFSPTLNPPSKSLKREGEGDAISATLSPKRARKADPVPEPLPEPEQKCSPSFGCVCAGSGACHLARSGLCFSQTQAVSAWRLWGGAKEEAKRYKGVRMRSPGRWTAELKDVRRGIRLWLGTHCSPEKAAQAYDNAARKLYGVAARTNFGKAMEGEVRREVYVQVGPAGRTVGEGGGAWGVLAASSPKGENGSNETRCSSGVSSEARMAVMAELCSGAESREEREAVGERREEERQVGWGREEERQVGWGREEERQVGWGREEEKQMVWGREREREREGEGEGEEEREGEGGKEAYGEGEEIGDAWQEKRTMLIFL